MFEVDELAIDTPALAVRYHLAPWDAPTVGGPVAVISDIEVRDRDRALDAFVAFRDWCTVGKVSLVSCKLPHHRLVESGFLESQGFRFIELNYRPELTGLQSSVAGVADEYVVDVAMAEDERPIAEIAGQIFDAGRFHQDPLIDPRVGDLRYRRWVSNAFLNPRQTVLKCRRGDEIKAFFVVESPAQDRRFWSLVGLAPGLGGRGVGTRIWRAMLQWHRAEGVDHVSTSISSLNAPIFNLYVKLGFRFPSPTISLHWCPFGRIEAPV